MESAAMKRVVLPVLALLTAVAAPALAQSRDCSSLPSTAQRARTCNPQQECLAKVQGRLSGPALATAQRDCQRLPTSGTCYGPETYDPQAECRAQQRRR
jgi:hypothetical protein